MNVWVVAMFFGFGVAGGGVLFLPLLGRRLGALAALAFGAWLSWAASSGHLGGSPDEPATCYDRQGEYRC